MELLEQHFDTAFSAPNGIQKLRELILKLALQGKLVPQESNDAPASQLLKEIEAEKKRLVKDGKIKTPKPLPEITTEDKPRELPNGWVWVRNGFLFGLRKGKVPKDLTETMGSIPYLDIEALDRGNIRRYTEDSKAPRSTDSDILVVCDGSRSGLVLDGQNGAIGSTLSVIETPLFIQPFVKLIFRQGYERMNSSMKGAAIPHLDSKNLLLEVIGLPPLAEQERILEKIDQLMTRCDTLENLRNERKKKCIATHAAALSQLLEVTGKCSADDAWMFIAEHFADLYAAKENVSELRKAILQLAVMGKLVQQDANDPPASQLLNEIEAEKRQLSKDGKMKAFKPLPPVTAEEIPYALPRGWEWVRVVDLTEVGTGSTPETTNRDYYNGSIPWYTSSATNDLFAATPDKFITEKAIKETNCKVFPAGSLIIAMYGQGKTRGQISEIVTPGATNQAIAAMVFYASSQGVKKYLKYFFVKIYEEIRLLAEGAAQPNLNVGKIKETLVPLAPLPEQQRIVAKIDQLMGLCDTLEGSITTAAGVQTELLNAVMAQV